MSFLPFALRAALLCGALALILTALRALPVWGLVAAVPLVALPLWISAAAGLALRRGHRLSKLAEGSRLQRLSAGITLRGLVTLLPAMAVAGLAIPQMMLFGPLDWALFAACFPVFALLHRLLAHLLGPELAEPFRRTTPVAWAGLGIVLFSLLAALGLHLLAPVPGMDAAGLDQLGVLPARSALLQQLLALARLMDNLRDYVLGRVEGIGGNRALGVLLAYGLGSGAVAALAAAMACLAAAPAELTRRAFSRASLASTPPRAGGAEVALLTAMVTVLILFLWLPFAAVQDARLARLAPADRPVPRAARDLRMVVVQAERIGQDYFRPGTIKALRSAARADMAELSARQADALRVAINGASDGMEANVDSFLDDYYSLLGEYLRLARMLSGGLEGALNRQLTQALSRGDPTGPLQALLSDKAIGGLLAQGAPARRAQFDAILNAARLDPPREARLQVTGQCQMAPCLDLKEIALQMNQGFDSRIAASGTLAGASGLVAALVVKKLVSKGVLKLAAKALTKALASKGAAALGGAAAAGATGAAAGSVVPGLGTMAGGVAGFVSGLAVGVGVDAALLQLEEIQDRAAFRAQIVSGIHDWRDQALATLDAPAEGQGRQTPPGSPHAATAP